MAADTINQANTLSDHDHALLLELWLEGLSPLHLCERFDLSLSKLLAWAESPRTRRELALLESVSRKQAADRAPAQQRLALRALESAAASHGCDLTPDERLINESARRAATTLLRELRAPTQPRKQTPRPRNHAPRSSPAFVGPGEVASPASRRGARRPYRAHAPSNATAPASTRPTTRTSPIPRRHGYTRSKEQPP